MGDCNPACVKILLNGGLIATTSEDLADLATSRGGVYEVVAISARQLQRSAERLVRAHDFLVLHGGLQRTGEANWQGCEHASQIAAWSVSIATGTSHNVEAIAGKLREYRVMILEQTHALVSGTIGS